ncbi:MAG: hypothetical protein Q3993_02520 [Filifactor alocis]|nr:hypothetical protein [Filifactor alocis]
MKTLIRIDKGYSILQKVKEKYEEEKILPELEDIRRRLKELDSVEATMRAEIDCLRNELREQEKNLVEVDRQIRDIVNKIYQCNDFNKLEELRQQEQGQKSRKVELNTMMFEKFTAIDVKLEELKNLKNRKTLLSLETKPYIKMIGAKEQKILEDIKKIEKKIRMLRKGVDNEALKAYDKKRISMGKVFYPVSENKCSYCGDIVESVFGENGSICECKSCGRLLYIGELSVEEHQ